VDYCLCCKEVCNRADLVDWVDWADCTLDFGSPADSCRAARLEDSWDFCCNLVYWDLGGGAGMLQEVEDWALLQEDGSRCSFLGLSFGSWHRICMVFVLA